MRRDRLWPIVAWVLIVPIAASGWTWPEEFGASPHAGRLFRPRAAETYASSAAADEVTNLASPDGRWIAVVNRVAGSLEIQRAPDGPATFVFPPGSTVGSASWSPDSRRLIAVRNNWTVREPEGTGLEVRAQVEIWSVEIADDAPQAAEMVFHSPTPVNLAKELPEQIVLGDWASDSRHVLFWIGMMSASVLADGLTPYILDVETYSAEQVAEGALLNPRYHSWAPDSSALVMTAGEYRSAQINKWLVVYDLARARATTVITSSEQVPGIVAWSPRGNVIAYAAVPAAETGAELADLGTWDNPAIAGRRVYLLDPATGESKRLNNTEGFQDAPLWSDDGLSLYYVERQADQLVLMAADPATGHAAPVPGATEPLPEVVGYYGQSNLDELLALRPGGTRTATDTPCAATATPRAP